MKAKTPLPSVNPQSPKRTTPEPRHSFQYMRSQIRAADSCVFWEDFSST